MVLDPQLLEILVCPQCKGGVSAVDGSRSLICNRCNLKYPVRDGIPVMLVDEALDLRSEPRGPDGSAVKLPRVTFRVVAGPDNNMTFQLERGTCRAIGRGSGDPNKTSVFNVDLTLALDDSMRGLVAQYVGKQFRKSGGADKGSADGPARRAFGDASADGLGHFRRAPDVILTDASLSRLHAMIFSEESGVGILDLVSKNGTFVNAQEIESKLLKSGDTIELGETTISFEG